MKTRIKARFGYLALAACLLAALLGTARSASASPARQPENPVAVVMAFFEAFNNGDTAKLDELLDPSFQDAVVNGPVGLPPEFYGGGKAQFMALAAQHSIQVMISNCQLTAPDTVACDAVLHGSSPEALPPLPHPYTEVSTFTVVNGRITQLRETLSADTVRDLEALTAQPGMPTTGSPYLDLLPTGLALAFLCFLAGMLVRRTSLSRR